MREERKKEPIVVNIYCRFTLYTNLFLYIVCLDNAFDTLNTNERWLLLLLLSPWYVILNVFFCNYPVEYCYLYFKMRKLGLRDVK